jgi:sn-glycerol 3-phosphate transport system substrate-binding protein
MHRRTLLTGTAALAATAPLAPALAQAARTKITWWHAMTGALAAQVDRIVKTFNASQSSIEVEAINKGTYPETMTATIAAWRANKAPHIAQVFDVGTGSMLAAGPATKQAWQLIQETKVAINPNAYIPAVRGYYSLANGKLAAMPFNSSTAIMWYNKDAFSTAGLDPEKPPATWEALEAALRKIKAKIDADAGKAADQRAMGTVTIPMTSSWFTWIQFEQYSAIHNIPFATDGDGFDGLGAVLKLNSPPMVKQLARFLRMSKEGTFKYAGRDSAPDAVFYSGQAAVGFGSSAGRGDILRNSRFKWGEALLPYDPSIIAKPVNSIIGGAALWAMTAKGRTAAEYKAVATFMKFLGTPEQDALWAENTGYVPVTMAGYELLKKQGYYQQPQGAGADVPITQLERGKVTQYSRGIRLGRLPEIRVIIYEEMEKALQGQQDAQQAMTNAEERGNKVLRDFQKSVSG